MNMRVKEITSQAVAEIVRGCRGPPEAARDWVIEMSDELKEVAERDPEERKRWEKASIYKIKGVVLNRDAYQPQMVSIGPYHHGEEQLKEMEVHKKRALATFLKRPPEMDLDFFEKALDPIAEHLKSAYYDIEPELKKESGTGKFLRMMILDGSFLLELMRTSPKPERNDDSYATNDPVFSEHSHQYRDAILQRDMLMLENQLPFQLLLKLVEARYSWGQKELTKQILKFFGCSDSERGNVKESEQYLHILDLYRASLIKPKPDSDPKPKPGQKQRNCLLDYRPAIICSTSKARGPEGSSKEQKPASSKKKQKQKKQNQKKPNMRSATELEESGILVQKSKTSYIDDIMFSGAVLKIPSRTVDDASKCLYLNMMAFERLHAGTGDAVTWYAFFMDRLIEDAGDVRLLNWRRVLDNCLGSDHDVAVLFNSLSTDVCIDINTRLWLVQENVMDYYRKPHRRYMAYAQRVYFTNPWVILSVVAAVFLFALTLAQTVYSVLDYHKKK